MAVRVVPASLSTDIVFGLNSRANCLVDFFLFACPPFYGEFYLPLNLKPGTFEL